MKSKVVLALLAAYLLTGCVQYASGYKKAGGGGSADSEASGEDVAADEGGETCLKLAQKRKAHLKLQDEEEVVEEEEEVVDEEEVTEDVEACAPAEEEVVEEEVTEEEEVVEE